MEEWRGEIKRGPEPDHRDRRQIRETPHRRPVEDILREAAAMLDEQYLKQNRKWRFDNERSRRNVEEAASRQTDSAVEQRVSNTREYRDLDFSEADLWQAG